ncbi:MAG: hypothetical protein F6K40_02540 [Okeania sp. SIO3I5]|uniref:hypothetical protein n=1 Tax=Okeania sp. SIO3I5 TaxID=2607805 RepID=UPI0013BBE864|nr:hypothetical protein [Okeania sp. SIO3I5]NEQ35244.1 hypothetical protein [Okeania sp. SIO3I5]
MTQITRRKVARGTPIYGDRPPLSPEEIDRRKAENEAFASRCREIFWRVYPDLVKEHYDWFIYIEPDSGDYFLDRDRDVARQKAQQKYPSALLMAMCVNETGAVGKI